MSTNVNTTESNSAAVVVSSEPPSNSNNAVSNGVTVTVGAESLDSKTETLTTEPSSTGITVQDLVDGSRVSGGEIGAVMDKDEKIEDGIAVKDPIHDARASVDELGLVVNNSEPVLDKSISDDVVSNRDIETRTTHPSADHNGDGDTVVQDPVDDSRASRDEKEVVTENIEKDNEVKIVAYSLCSETETLTMKPSADHNEKVSNEIEVEEKAGEYKVTDIVWAKVKNYPWWPGQIFDPSAATDKAKKFSNKKGFLVGYFGDQSFAWNKAPNIKPFRKNFSKLEKQSTSKPYLHAVNCALDEVSRRVEFGLTCSCLSKEVYDKVKSQVFVNSGIREEDSNIDGGDRFSTVSIFKPVKVVQSVQDLARGYFDGVSRLEVLSVRTQLLAFFRWKGYYQLQAQDIWDGPDDKLEVESEVPLTEENKVDEDEKLASIGKKVSSKKRKPDVSDSDDMTPKGNSSAKRSKKGISKKATVDDDVVKEENGNEKSESVGKKVSSKKRKPVVSESDSDDSVPRKKERSVTKVTSKGSSSAKRSKKGISKKATVDDDVINEEHGNEKQDSVGKKVSSKKRKPVVSESDSDDSVPCKKERSLTKITSKGSSSVKRSKNNMSKKASLKDNVSKEENGNGTDNKKSPISSPKKFRIGDSICKIAKQISESPSIVKESEKSKNDEKSVTLRKTAEKDGQPVEAI